MPAQRRLWLTVTITIAVILVAVAYFLKLHDRLTDFTVFYTAGHRFLHAEPLYQATDGHYQFKYLPFSALFFVPLALLPIEAARLVWLYIVVAAVVTLVALARKLSAGSPVSAIIVAVTILAMLKFYVHEIDLGQANAVMTALILFVVYFLQHDREVSAGLLLALATAFKPYSVIFLPLLLVRRKFRAAGIAVLATLTAVFLPAFAYGWRGNLDLLAGWRLTATASTPGLLTNNDNVSLFGCLAKWLGATDSIAIPIVAALVAAAIAFALFIAIKRTPFARPRQTDESPAKSGLPLAVESAILLILIPLISPQGWDYVFLTATLGIMLLLAYRRLLPRSLRWLMFISLVLIGASLYDLMGRLLYFKFMQLSLLTPLFLYLEFCLLWLRFCLPRTYSNSE